MLRIFLLICCFNEFAYLGLRAEGRLLATGWDSPSTADYRKYSDEFLKLPFDGTSIRVLRILSNGSQADARNAFHDDKWQESELKASIEDLRDAHPHLSRHNFLIVYATPGDIDWFDDTGWRCIEDHWRLLAMCAKVGRAKGLLFDPEPYQKPFRQFSYCDQPQSDKHTYDEYARKARERGRTIGRMVAQEFPDIIILCLRLFSDRVSALRHQDGNPIGAAGHIYDLLHPFVGGWLDAMPVNCVIVEGNEQAYGFNSELEYYRAYTELKKGTVEAFGQTHMTREHASVDIAHGVYLDAYLSPRNSKWHIQHENESTAARLERNVSYALMASDRYVWIRGERGRWWPGAGANHALWSSRIPGIEEALRRARFPRKCAVDRTDAAPPSQNMVVNGRFEHTESGNTITGWTQWAETWRGTYPEWALYVEPGGNTVVTARRSYHGTLGQHVSVQAGKTYAVSVRSRTFGNGTAACLLRWCTTGPTWTAPWADCYLTTDTPHQSNAWVRHAGLARVPQGASSLALLLSVSGQSSTGDSVWFDDVSVVPLE